MTNRDVPYVDSQESCVQPPFLVSVVFTHRGERHWTRAPCELVVGLFELAPDLPRVRAIDAEFTSRLPQRIVKALVFQGQQSSAWLEVPAPVLIDPTDVIVRVELTTICASDLNILRGAVPEVPFGLILGHEAVGTVVEVGSAVSRVNVGDRVLVSCISACGACENCQRTRFGQCEGGGGWILGRLIHGTQAEYVRVPFADSSTHAIPDSISDEAMLMIADILPTAYEAGVLAGTVHPGDVVVVIGASPVGLAAIASASLFEPKALVVVDDDDARLTMATVFGASVTMNSNVVDPVEEIKRLTQGVGANVVIDAVGLAATFEMAALMAHSLGHLAKISVHGDNPSQEFRALSNRELTITSGGVDTFSTPTLVRLVASGQLRAGDFVTHRFDFGDFERAYDTFTRADETNALKVVLSAPARERSLVSTTATR